MLSRRATAALNGAVFLALSAHCSFAQTPPRAPATTTPPTAQEDAAIDQTLGALLGQGEAIAQHVGPDAAQRMFDDLQARPARYLDRIEAIFLRRPMQSMEISLWFATPLWRLRTHDEARVRNIAQRLYLRYQPLTYQTPANDPGFQLRLQRTLLALATLRDPIDLVMGPRWRAIPAGGASICLGSGAANTLLVRATRDCSCGEPLACRATFANGAVQIELRYNPEAPGICTDCYPTTASCTLPSLPANASVPVRIDQTVVATWQTNEHRVPSNGGCSGFSGMGAGNP